MDLRNRWISCGCLLALLCSGAAQAASAPSDIRRDAAVEAVERVMPAVVNISTETVVERRDPYEELLREFFGPFYRRRPPNAYYSLGSGVIIDEEGYVLTNYHVVGRATRVRVRLADGREFEADPVNFASTTDVALLKIRTTKDEKFTAVEFAAGDDLLLGETVLALGNPFGLGGSVTKGILSSKSRRPPLENEPLDVPDWLQTDAAINPGNSGGALINLRGELIGINVAIYREGQGIGFAVPVKRIAQALTQIFTPEAIKSLWFGARIKVGERPLTVLDVQPESPAHRAGLRGNDRILTVNGKAPRGFIDFNRALIDAGDQREVTLVILRGADRRSLTLRLVQEKTFFNAALIQERLGATVQELTRELAQAMALSGVDGLLVAAVDKEGPAAAVELEAGVVITGVDGRATADVVTAAKLFHAKSKGERARLDIVVPLRYGNFVGYRRAAVEVALR